ncbi:tRNA (guanosine(37)-N1)-methyltransferase TrmD [Rhodospirillaceae bacterium KN72]|uniref:tRNA (guanine-N(1)-)-methyltransferase n=1 Tax=Pacificispira spongiicola TaxID=2729598 RepID=A0A7Y0E128_9PROT|nr:tRNA (guanosine(37)-N1)-methyltransferase TrmD [Pacificispira spongiicola]NMM44506.1 tRNA (guanosine(37)-N1)-methyltransferase TrmD [Pacificispira spongiicola]
MTVSPWTVTALTLFPEMFPGPLGQSLAGKALENGLWKVDTVDIRSFATDKHKTVDDAPMGGGAGMVMRPDVIDAALASVADAPGPLVYPSPRGRVFDQTVARELAAEPGVRILCGRYEGVDQRVLDKWEVREISLGDFILSGGEPAALVMLDACLRLIPGVMGSSESLEEESFESGLLEYPLYTRPAEWEGRKVPDVLLSGHHENIRAWRRAQAEAVTKRRRPDLWTRYAGAENVA